MNVDGSAPRQLTTPNKGDQITQDILPAWSPDGQRIVFIGSIPNVAWYGMYIMNADGSQVKRVASSAAEMTSPAWSPDGQLIAFSVGSMPMFDLYTIRPDGTMAARVNDHFDTGMYPSWSPQGDRLVYSDGRIFASRMDNSKPTMLSAPTTSWSDYDPAWSPR
jgi:TolB protein